MTLYQIDPDQLRLACKIHNTYHETVITSYKTNKKTF